MSPPHRACTPRGEVCSGQCGTDRLLVGCAAWPSLGVFSIRPISVSAHPTQLTSAAESSCAKAHDAIACLFGIETEVSPSMAHRTLGWKAAADGVPARRYRLRLKKLEREHTPGLLVDDDGPRAKFVLVARTRPEIQTRMSTLFLPSSFFFSFFSVLSASADLDRRCTKVSTLVIPTKKSSQSDVLPAMHPNRTRKRSGIPRPPTH